MPYEIVQDEINEDVEKTGVVVLIDANDIDPSALEDGE